MFHLLSKKCVYIFTIVCLFLGGNIYSQQYLTYNELDSVVNEKYSFDQFLVNGVLFVDLYRTAIGHPYYLVDEYLTGSLTINNKTYTKQNLKYNCYEQNLQLYYHDASGNQIQIVPPVDFISEFTINKAVFKRFDIPKRGNNFCQVVQEGEISCVYYWYKNRQESMHERKFLSYEFSDDKKEKYIIYNNQLLKFSGKLSFLKLFPDNKKNEINSFIKKNKIKLRSADIKITQQLIQKTEEILYNNQ